MNASGVAGSTVIDNLYDSVEALEAKVGADSSAVDTSHDYLLTNSSSSNPGHKHTLADGASDVTASASELNKLDGATVTTSEINILDGVTSNATELNYLDGVTAGTAVASKALVVDSNKDIDLDTGDITATVGTFDDDIRLANAKSIQQKDSGGTYRDIITLNGSDVLQLGDGTNMEVVLGSRTMCRAYLSSAQNNLADSSFTKVLLDAESFDIGSDFDTTNSRFVAPVTGYYDVYGTVGFKNTIDGARLGAFIYANETRYSSGACNIGSTKFIEQPVADLVYVESGQYIELYAYVNAGAATIDLQNEETATYLSIRLVAV